VGSLSCQVMSQPVSLPLQLGLHFFQPPTPAQPSFASRQIYPEGAVLGYHVPLTEFVGLGACCRPESFIGYGGLIRRGLPALVPVWACDQSLTHVRTHGPSSQIHMCSPYQLPSTHPTRDYQEGTPLAIYSPPCGFVTLSGQLFIHGPRLTRQHGWFHPSGTTHITRSSRFSA